MSTRIRYDSTFMAYTAAGSRRSADLIVRLLLNEIPIKSVLDVGCATGTWLRAWSEAGVSNIHGIDGDYVDTSQLEIARQHFTPADLTREIMLGQTFDLIQSLEVGEHILPQASETFVNTITRHSNGLILFSAAPPGQGGEFHINENTYDYWRKLFLRHRFVAFDYIRSRISNEKSIAFWYRFNTILYVRADVIDQLPSVVRRTKVQDDMLIPDVSPPWFKLRKVVVRRLPKQVQNGLARLKARARNAISSL